MPTCKPRIKDPQGGGQLYLLLVVAVVVRRLKFGCQSGLVFVLCPTAALCRLQALRPNSDINMSTASTSRSLPRPLHLVLNTTGTAALPTSPSASIHAPLSAPLSRERNEMKDVDATKSKPSARRQSSISYNTGSSQARSSRRNSLGSKAVLGGGEKTQGDENGFSSQRVSLSPDVRETEPITLAEKCDSCLY